jgi:putative ABC transport system substrate-binding protein
MALGAGVLGVPIKSAGQQPRIWRVGFLAPGSGDTYYKELSRAMAKLGYVTGKNLVIEFRQAKGRYERLPALAADLVDKKVDVIVVNSTPAAKAAKQATAAIPIVLAIVGDPVGSGFVTSLARPGGNITGLSLATTDTSAKWLELAKLLAPKSRVAILANPNTGTVPRHTRNIQAAAQKLGSDVFSVFARSPDDFESAFATMVQERAEVVIVLPDGMFTTEGKRIAQLALKLRVASVASSRDYVESGMLIGYGQDYMAFMQLAAKYVDKIFKGAKPAELPIEQPTIMELVINRATAAKLGLTMPQELMLRADRVID